MISQILSFYGGETPAVKLQILRLLTHGALKNTGRVLIYPVDQGFEHGPVRAFGAQYDSFDPHYHFKMAIEGEASAYAAPLGWIEAGVDTFLGQVPLILKMNSSNRLLDMNTIPDQAITSSVDDAVRLGCIGIGITIYPGSNKSLDMMEEARELIKEARSKGLMSIVWSYARGSMSKEHETAIDVISYGAHMAALLGAHVIKVKIPSDLVESKDLRSFYEPFDLQKTEERIRLVVQSCFNGRRIIVFSGGETKTIEHVYNDVKAIRDGGGYGSIIGRNCFQRPYKESIDLMKAIAGIYK
jgi:class I fructose-bisphosphate aldolase